jgi:GNAT superfamily N-acetyltransferase
MSFRFKEVDADEPHYRDDLIELHDLTFFDPMIRPDLPRGYWWLVYDEASFGTYNRIKPHVAIGFCGLTHTLTDPNTGYLKRAGVLRDYRGQGLQRRMITVRERKARRLGLTTMLTDTTDNPASANSLIRAGYKIFEPAYRWAFNHSIYWKKDLTR